MQWRGRQQSTNVEDRRGQRSKGGRRMRAAGGIGVGGIVIALVVMFMGGDPSVVLNNLPSTSTSTQAPPSSSRPRATTQKEKDDKEFVSVVLKDTEDAWEKIFREQLGRAYRKPTLVLFTGRVQSRCGYATSDTGPFYCPGDQKLYIDMVFYEELRTKFRAPGDFAMAYVVAHEVGHHVQYLLGKTREVSSQRNRISKAAYNRLSVRLELQADFYAGVWAHHAQKMKGILDKGDIDEALTAANAIGDDNLQRKSRGYVIPESFTHGTSAQRKRWYKKGLQSGDMRQGNTFAVSDAQL